MSKTVIVIGAGIAGLSATLAAAERGQSVLLVSDAPSERAQSVMASEGINAVLRVGEGDSPEQFFDETIRAGHQLGHWEAVSAMVSAAPSIIGRLMALGVRFDTDSNRQPDLRGLGGHRRKRTVYSGASTGKQIVTALIQAVRKLESMGLVTRYDHHGLVRFIIDEHNECLGCLVMDRHTGTLVSLTGSSVIMASGGMQGLFGKTTGSVYNTGAGTAQFLKSGGLLANLEMIQYHPTAAAGPGRMLLISETCRSLGGRLYVLKNGKPWYFMEEWFPDMGALMPRDMVSRSIHKIINDPGLPDKQVYLDLSDLPEDTVHRQLADVRADCMTYLKIDPCRSPIPVVPCVHYFMGGIYVDAQHKTSVKRVFAAGECCSQYHGAGMLGGNALLSAIYGGMTAGVSASAMPDAGMDHYADAVVKHAQHAAGAELATLKNAKGHFSVPALLFELQSTLGACMAIERDQAGLMAGLQALDHLYQKSLHNYDPASSLYANLTIAPRVQLGKAMITSAMARKESRGAHQRRDFPSQDESYMRTTVISPAGDALGVVLIDVNRPCINWRQTYER